MEKGAWTKEHGRCDQLPRMAATWGMQGLGTRTSTSSE